MAKLKFYGLLTVVIGCVAFLGYVAFAMKATQDHPDCAKIRNSYNAVGTALQKDPSLVGRANGAEVLSDLYREGTEKGCFDGE